MLDSDDSKITTCRDSLKAKYMLRDPRVSLFVDDNIPPFSFIIIDGVEGPNLDELLKWTTEIAGRYMGQNNSEAYGKRNGLVERKGDPNIFFPEL
jgi:hypothetical protein